MGNEEAVFSGPDYWVLTGGGGGVAVNDLCRRHGFSEASSYRWRSKFGGMTGPDAQRLKALEQAVTQEMLRKKW